MSAGRRTCLIAYDIRDEKRLRRVHKFVSRHARALQYSLFVADLDEAGLAVLIAGLTERADPRADDVRIYALHGATTGAWKGPLPEGDGTWLFGSPAFCLAERFSAAPWRARLGEYGNET